MNKCKNKVVLQKKKQISTTPNFLEGVLSVVKNNGSALRLDELRGKNSFKSERTVIKKNIFLIILEEYYSCQVTLHRI